MFLSGLLKISGRGGNGEWEGPESSAGKGQEQPAWEGSERSSVPRLNSS